MAEPHLPPAELELLACLHRRGSATARELRDDLHRSRPMTHGSVLTLLGRLEQRGVVTRHKGPHGKAFLYTPRRTPAAAARPVLTRLVQRVFGGRPVDLLASLFESRPPTADELHDLERLVRELKKKGRSR